MSVVTDRLIKDITRERHFHFRLFLEGLLIGACSGIVIAVFRYLLSASEDFRPYIYNIVANDFLSGSYGITILYISVFIVLAWLLLWIVRNEPMCTGSGIPQIKGILMGKMSMNWASVLFSKLVGGVLAIGAGLSLGREGPSVQMGACVGQGISRSIIRTRYEERILITAGAGAGLAAAFNAPLAGVIFSLEELHKGFSPVVLMATVTAAVAATTVTQLLFGIAPVFHIGELELFPFSMYLALIGLGLYIGVLGRIFNPSLLLAMDVYDRFRVKGIYKPLIPLALAACLGFVLPEILGGGNRLVDALSVNAYPLYFLCILFVGKFLFTAICFGSGVPGGIFLPMLVLGAAGGSIFSNLLVSFELMPAMYAGDIIVFAMAAYFAAVVKSPVTGSVLIMEMTGSFEHLLPLICVSMTAYMTADLTGGKPVYEELLNRSLNKADGSQDHHLGRRITLEVLVESGSPADKSRIMDVDWPVDTVIVNIKRNSQRIVPRDNIQLLAGDYIYVLINEMEIVSVRKLVEGAVLPKR
ncbi:MAG: chloride channel protein [Anaerovibrio sp.]|nr:chloride channel protein [Anaerovibrio sp.]